jgi:hypothetical protein
MDAPDADCANLACSACAWSSKIFLNDRTAYLVSDEDELDAEESSSIGGVIGRGNKGGGSIHKGVRERPRAPLGVVEESERDR